MENGSLFIPVEAGFRYANGHYNISWVFKNILRSLIKSLKKTQWIKILFNLNIHQ